MYFPIRKGGFYHLPIYSHVRGGLVGKLEDLTMSPGPLSDYLGVSKNRGGPPIWMVYKGKPY